MRAVGQDLSSVAPSVVADESASSDVVEAGAGRRGVGHVLGDLVGGIRRRRSCRRTRSSSVAVSSVTLSAAVGRLGRLRRGAALGGRDRGRRGGGTGRGVTDLGARARRGRRRGRHAGGLRGLGAGRALVHQLDDRHVRVVTLARQRLHDARVATGPVREERADLGEQAVHDVLVPDLLLDETPVVQVALLGLGDQPLRVRAQPVGLGARGVDAAVGEERRGQVGQHQLLVVGGTPEPRALAGLGHVECSCLVTPFLPGPRTGRGGGSTSELLGWC